ncbi:hypothetical protein K2X30_10610 [bacterium]|nr:hypothetical protein [bacterium]
MRRGISSVLFLCAISTVIFSTDTSVAADVNSTVIALRLSNTITGGSLPVSDPIFTNMANRVQAGDIQGAAALAANSKYFAGYLARRLAMQMQNAALDAFGMTDNDSTAFIIAKFAGSAGGGRPSISSLWSDNATYLVDLAGVPTHVASLNATQLAAVDWTALVRQEGQQVKDTQNVVIPLPAKHVGGYLTLSDRPNDNSFAMYGATAGTNLRFIEGIWETATGLELMNVASKSARVQDVPRFIPEYDPNFFNGQGQPACIACHGGGMASVNHGYAAVADIFDFTNNNGFIYNAAPATNQRKSLGSNAGQRNNVNTCNLVQRPTTVCNPDSVGVDANQSWDLAATWEASGVLSRMGWTGAKQGQGLNALGVALGQSKIVYEFLTERVIGEVCPMGSFSASDIASIAASANPNASTPGTDDIRTIVARVASHASCL